MSETQFTPGPWVLEPTPSGLAVEVFSGDEYICRTRVKYGALIAAAPDLYAALVKVLAWVENPNPSPPPPPDASQEEWKKHVDAVERYESNIWDCARAALAKARGET